MSSMIIGDHAFIVAREAEWSSSRSRAIVSGHQFENGDDTERFVALTFIGAERYAQRSLYAALHLTPDEARGLAARLLDAADTADENIDAPIEYSLV